MLKRLGILFGRHCTLTCTLEAASLVYTNHAFALAWLSFRVSVALFFVLLTLLDFVVVMRLILIFALGVFRLSRALPTQLFHVMILVGVVHNAGEAV